MTEEEINRQTEKAWKDRLLNLRGAYESAMKLIDVCESRAYNRGIADCSKILSYCYWRFSDYSLSLTHSMRALDIYQKLGDRKGEADTLNNVGAVYMFQNDHEKRLEVNLKCKELRKQIGDLEGVASSEGNIGETYLEMGDYKNALLRFESVLSDENAAPQGIAWSYHNIGRIHDIHGDVGVAIDNYTKALELGLSVNYDVLVTENYLTLTDLYVKQKEFKKAIENAEKSLTLSRNIGAKETEKKSLYFLSKIYETIGEFETSLKYHKDYHSIDVEISRDTEIERLKTMQLKVAYEKIEEQKNQLIDSIRYAEHIQQAVLTRDQNQELLSKYFIYFEPKDIVSGDFYWYYEKNRYFYICVADCTGHGVPGALLTMLGTTFLNEIVALNENASPAFILDRLRYRLIKALSQNNERTDFKDGMDISLLKFDVKTKEAEWAGAYNPIWIVRKNKNGSFESDVPTMSISNDSCSLYEIKGDRFPVGIMEDLKPFTDHSFQLQYGDIIYLMSDGFADQFGGTQGKKYRTGPLKQRLLQLNEEPIETHGELLKNELNEWKGDIEQVDDICILGIEIIEIRDEDLR